jgi:hypothetical protein
MPHRRHAPPLRWTAGAVVGCVLASTAMAQPPTVADPVLVVTRTVNPRIAYRGLARDDNPVKTQATMFPGNAFAGALDDATGQLLGDDALGQRGSAGLGGGALAIGPLLGNGTRGLLGSGGFGGGPGAATPTGPGARHGGVAGAVLDATAGLGTLLGQAGHHP